MVFFLTGSRIVMSFDSGHSTLTLEDYARITGFSLVGPCTRVLVGHMH